MQFVVFFIIPLTKLVNCFTFTQMCAILGGRKKLKRRKHCVYMNFCQKSLFLFLFYRLEWATHVAVFHFLFFQWFVNYMANEAIFKQIIFLKNEPFWSLIFLLHLVDIGTHHFELNLPFERLMSGRKA